MGRPKGSKNRPKPQLNSPIGVPVVDEAKKAQNAQKRARRTKQEVAMTEYYAQVQGLQDTDSGRELLQKITVNAVEFYKIGTAHPVQNNAELDERITNFFSICEQSMQHPTPEKLLLALGIRKATFRRLRHGEYEALPWADENTGAMIAGALEVCGAVDADLVNDGRINTVGYIFRSKNWYQMQDSTETVHVIKDDRPTAAALIARAQELPTD